MIGCLIWFLPFLGLVGFEWIGLDPTLGLVLGIIATLWLWHVFINDDPGEPPGGPGMGGM